MNKRKMINTQYGKMYIDIGTYDVGKRIAILLYMENGELFDDLTINLPELPVKKGEVFINSWLDSKFLDCFLKEGIIKKYCGKVQYNMGQYNKVELNLNKLKEYDYLGYNEFMGKYQPFHVCKDIDKLEIILDQYDYEYDWVLEERIADNQYGDGHCYDDLFNDYLQKNNPDLNKKLHYDSENGMFCVYCEDQKVAHEVGKILSELYNDEKKMIELIKETKKIHNYEFKIKM